VLIGLTAPLQQFFANFSQFAFRGLGGGGGHAAGVGGGAAPSSPKVCPPSAISMAIGVGGKTMDASGIAAEVAEKAAGGTEGVAKSVFLPIGMGTAAIVAGAQITVDVNNGIPLGKALGANVVGSTVSLGFSLGGAAVGAGVLAEFGPPGLLVGGLEGGFLGGVAGDAANDNIRAAAYGCHLAG
jgi:hypothetical protein